LLKICRNLKVTFRNLHETKSFAIRTKDPIKSKMNFSKFDAINSFKIDRSHSKALMLGLRDLIKSLSFLSLVS